MKWVFYKGKLYNIIKVYENSGMVEIKEVNGHKIELVELKHLAPYKKKDTLN